MKDYKYLEMVISNRLHWKSNTDVVCKTGPGVMYGSRDHGTVKMTGGWRDEEAEILLGVTRMDTIRNEQRQLRSRSLEINFKQARLTTWFRHDRMLETQLSGTRKRVKPRRRFVAKEEMEIVGVTQKFPKWGAGH